MTRWIWDERAATRDTRLVAWRDADGRAITNGEAFAALRDDAAARAFLAEHLARSENEAFFFEVAPLTTERMSEPLEIALVDAPMLARSEPDPSDFEEHFERAPEIEVVVFPNLGRDALLIVPAPRAPDAVYGHLASFVRAAPPAQVDELLAKVARSVWARISSRPLWVSTAGLGVPWLHVRLDSHPKYFRHAPFTRMR